MPFAARHRRLRSAFPEDIDGLLVSGPANIRWVSGFSGSISVALVPAAAVRAPTLAVDSRYINRARTESPECELLGTRAYGPDLIAHGADQGMRRIGIEADHVLLTQFETWEAVAADLGVELVRCTAVIEPLRQIKDESEIAALRAACRATDEAFALLLSRLRPGLTEREIDWMLISLLRDCGADGPAFDAIVAAGEHGATPHHLATDRPLRIGDLLTLDFGGAVGGMHADMTRTVAIGPVDAWQQELHALVEDIAAELRARVAPGVDPHALNARSEQRLTSSGHRIAHGLGHGVGLEIHEEPWLTSASTSSPLAIGTTLTIEPGAYPDGADGGPTGGVRIEDTLLVVAAGSESLTNSDRGLIEIG